MSLCTKYDKQNTDTDELQGKWLGAESYTDNNGNHYKPGVDLIGCNSFIENVENISFYFF